MNKKLARTGPRIRVTKPAIRPRRVDDSSLLTRPVDGLYEDRTFIYTCQYCRIKFTHNSSYFRHMTTNHASQQQQATFECNNCQIIFTKKSNLDMHLQTHHQLKSKSRCDSCSITFKSRYCLRRHMMLKQLMQENTCRKCQKKFTSKEGLSKHYQNKHMFKNVTFQCDFCSLNFKANESLITHLNRVHKKL
ncbi:unnamed protein product [Plutella xylostella]|uniref:(diamondback moth) hypothetical protein n=1 Tax=Plutella xylostella TaxID=51655 RepID=A0A8S4EX99_PLUXY|nr:transcription factor hamlet [Plutella xylostella]CAG9120304.1 unnamed protein product [Plutella xylostella]